MAVFCRYSDSMPDEPLNYAKAGVDIDAASRALRDVQAEIAATHDVRVVGGIGGFGGLFSGHFGEMEQPLLVSSIDGVGTKTKVAAMMGSYSGLGVDIVHHCANDILCQGAKPLFFLDYYGCDKLQSEVFTQILSGMAGACQGLGIALIGGETAEMPGVYAEDEFDVVGAIVGVVDSKNRLPRGHMSHGDRVIGIASSGLHTNGYSLARRALFEVGGLSVRDAIDDKGTTLGDALLMPHRCYVPALSPLLDAFPGIFALAHITGGGIVENLTRVLGKNAQAMIHKSSWEVPQVMRMIQDAGQISDAEMYRAFNMGIGMIVVCDAAVSGQVIAQLNASGEFAAEIGEIQMGTRDVQLI